MFFLGAVLLAVKIIKSPFSLTLYVLKKSETVKSFFRKYQNRKSVDKFDKSRRAFIASSGVFLAGYAFVGAGVGVLGKDKYEIIRKNIFIKNLPEKLNGITITLISDVHSGPYMTESKMKEYASIINDIKSDLILIPGDLTNSRKDEIHPFVNAFSGLKAGYGVYATLGNHDYFSDAEYISKIINENTDIKLLRNNSEIININGENLVILGSEDTKDSGTKNNNKILKNIETSELTAIDKVNSLNLDYSGLTKILLCHKPYIFDELKNKDINLVLSGHTHGGQVVFASVGDYSLSFAGIVNKYVQGLYQNGDIKLYISKGLGTVGLPLRVNCPPEISVLTLNR